jgi:NhaA family Na+:H+ antiporter
LPEYVPERSSTTSRGARSIVRPIQDFLATETTGGILLLAATAAALLWSNFPVGDSYGDFWRSRVTLDLSLLTLDLTLATWVNDGLMTVFFFVVGLEIKRELVRGELADRQRATLPFVAAVGGMIAPALIYLAVNAGGDGERGWGIPMATDIAFAVGVLALLGPRVPLSLKVFVLAVAIVDDIGAILVIAVFYTEAVNLAWLAVAAGLCALVIVLARWGVRDVIVYVVIGGFVWLAAHESGVHATIAGVVLGMLTPAVAHYDTTDLVRRGGSLMATFAETAARPAAISEGVPGAALRDLEKLSRGSQPVLDRLEHALHPWTSYAVVPLFALANAGIRLNGDLVRDSVTSPVSLGVVLALMVGKPAGIMLASAIAVRLGLAGLPDGVRWPQVLGASMLAGIGFTVSIFIAGLAFSDASLVDEAKVGILAASAMMGLLGFVALRWRSPKTPAVAA